MYACMYTVHAYLEFIVLDGSFYNSFLVFNFPSYNKHFVI